MNLTLQQLGDGLGMSKQAVSKHVHRGMPRDSIEAAVDWYKRNKNPAQRKRQPVNERIDSRTLRVGSDESFEQARTRKEIAIADQAEMEVDELRKVLVRAADVRTTWAKTVVSVREAFLQLPSRLVPLLVVESDAHKIDTLLRQEINDVLSQFTK